VIQKSRPACDRHTNLQMIDCWIRTPDGQVPGYICAVPSCPRQHDGIAYLELSERKGSDYAKNRLEIARSAILKALSR
jgi:hypothetical protein